MIMAYKARINNCIWAQESDYRDSPAGNLERTSLVRTMSVPLQQGFYSDSKRSFSVAIDGLTAFLAFEQRIVGTMPLPDSTAVGTPFARVPAINDVQMNIIVEASLSDDASEPIEWDSQYFPIEPLPLRIESFQLLDGNIGIISISQFDYFPSHLTEIGLDEVPFISPNLFESLFSLETSLIGKRLEHGFSFHNPFTLRPDVLPEIHLANNPAIGRNNADGEMLGIDIYAENIFSMADFLFFRQKSDHLQIRSQSEGLASPSVCKKACESLVIPVLFNRNGSPLSRIHSEFNKEISLRAESLAVSGNIELDGQTIDFVRLAFPCITDERTANLNIKRGVCLAG
jgi:hypothetical protein